jgi:hypothetical protein
MDLFRAIGGSRAFWGGGFRLIVSCATKNWNISCLSAS